MFWHSRRPSLREQVLNSLIDVDPDRRRPLLEQEAGRGVIDPAEVEDALRLVQRIESLRYMSDQKLLAAVSVPREKDTPDDRIGARKGPRLRLVKSEAMAEAPRRPAVHKRKAVPTIEWLRPDPS